MKYGFWSDGTPCGDKSTEINEYFEGREFEHKQLGHAVIQGYAEYIEGHGNMFAIVYDQCVGIVLVNLDEFFSVMRTQMNFVNRLKFDRFFFRYFVEGKHYERDRAAYLKTLELEKKDTVVSSEKMTTELKKEPRKSIRIVINRSSSDDEIVVEPQCQSARTTKLTSVP